MKVELAKLTKFCDHISERTLKDNVQPAVMPSFHQVEAKLDTVIADVEGLKELTILLKLQNEVSDDNFHAYSLVVDKLEKNVLHIENYLC